MTSNLEPKWPPRPPTWSQDCLNLPTWSEDGPKTSNLEPAWPQTLYLGTKMATKTVNLDP
eukprot:1408542-Karenia_brevis.AAC.1